MCRHQRQLRDGGRLLRWQGRPGYRGCCLRGCPKTYANVLVVKEGNENDPAIQALYAALTSDKVKDYINSTYDGAVVPIF